jgi:integrator complex subunit 8
MAFGMAQEKLTSDAGDSLYGFIWDLTILEFLINLHTKRNEISKRQQAVSGY